MSALTLQNLTKRYGGAEALAGVSLSVEPGQRVALLGHNGAGKTTLMKIVLGLIGYDGGQVSVMGAAPGSPAARAATAYLPENVAFHSALTGREQIAHYLRLRGLPAKGAADLLAQALIGQPGLLILDEPTSGLDPVSRREFYVLVDELAAQGAAVLLSSHALTEVEARTDRIAILSQGHLVALGTMADLRASAGLPVALHVTTRPGREQAVTVALPGAANENGRITLSVPQDAKLQTLARIADLGEMVADVDVVPPSLEDIYTRISRRAAE